MTRARYADVVVDPSGVPVAAATIDVYDTGTTTPIAGTIYAAATGGTTLPNPIVANAQGEIEFWLDAPAKVDLKYTRPGYVTETHTVDVLDALHGHIGTYVPVADLVTETAARTAADLLKVDKNSTVLNVKDFAATSAQKALLGNGTTHPLSGFYANLAAAQVDYPLATATTNELDWAVIQKTITAAGSAAANGTSAIVYIPSGTWRLGTSSIALSSDSLCIRGDGRVKTIIQSYTGSTAMVVNSATGTRRQDCRIEGLSLLVGNTAGSGACAIRFENVYKSVLRDLRLQANNTLGVGIDLVGDAAWATYFNSFYEVNITAARACVRADTEANSNRFYGGTYDGTGYAVEIPGSSSLTTGQNVWFGTAMQTTGANTSDSVLRLGAAASGSGEAAETQFIACRIEAFTPVTLNLDDLAHRTQFIGGTWSADVTLVEELPGQRQNLVMVPNRSLFLFPDSITAGDLIIEQQGAVNEVGAGYGIYEAATDHSIGTSNKAYFSKITIPRRITVNRIVIGVAVASGNIDVGIYAHSAGNPGLPLARTGSMACPAAGRAAITISNLVLDPGVYWFAITCDNTTATFRGNARIVDMYDTREYTAAFPLTASAPGAGAATTRAYCVSLERA